MPVVIRQGQWTLTQQSLIMTKKATDSLLSARLCLSETGGYRERCFGF